MTLAKAPNTCTAAQKKNGEVCGRPCTGKLCGLHDPKARTKRGAGARAYYAARRERKKPALVRTVTAAVVASAVYLSKTKSNDPCETDWPERAWAMARRSDPLSDLSSEQLDELFPVFIAALVYEVHQVRPFVSAPWVMGREVLR